MIETRNVDTINTKKILAYCPYFDDIINYDADYDDELSIDLTYWYRDYVMSCDSNDKIAMEKVKKIDKGMYYYINSSRYRNGLKKIISTKDIDLNSQRSNEKLVKKILSYTDKYETMEILTINCNKWL